jgi:outer membrane lipoprotein SlyB
VQVEQTVRYGIVDQVRAVVIQGNNIGIGGVAGAGLNGVTRVSH